MSMSNLTATLFAVSFAISASGRSGPDQDPMSRWENCGAARILTLKDFGIPPGKSTGMPYFDDYTGAKIFRKSEAGFSHGGRDYDFYVATGEIADAGSTFPVTGRYQEGVTDWTAEHLDEVPPGVMDLSQILLPIGEGKLVMASEVECTDSSASHPSGGNPGGTVVVTPVTTSRPDEECAPTDIECWLSP